MQTLGRCLSTTPYHYTISKLETTYFIIIIIMIEEWLERVKIPRNFFLGSWNYFQEKKSQGKAISKESNLAGNSRTHDFKDGYDFLVSW